MVTLTPGPVDGFEFEIVRQPNTSELTKLYKTADILILSNLSLRLLYPLLYIRRPFGLRHHSESAFGLSKSLFSFDILRRWIMARAHHFVTSKYIGRVSSLPEYTVTSPFANTLHIKQDIIKDPTERSGALFVGRVEPEKGVNYLLDRWPLIQETLGVEELRIVGDGSLAGEVQKRIDSGLKNVTLVGRLEGDQTAREMGRAAYIIVPSLWQEPFGAVALEAVAAGGISIVADRGGLSEAAGELGIMYDPDDDKSFVLALNTARETRNNLLSGPEAWAAYRLQVQRHLDRFEPANVVQTIIETMAPDRGKVP